MSKEINAEELWSEVLGYEIMVADLYLTQLNWLPAGTYTANNLHSMMTQQYGRAYYKQDVTTLNRRVDNPKYALQPIKQYRIPFKRGYFNVLDLGIFNTIVSHEKYANQTGSKAHIWLIKPRGKLLTSFNIEMPHKSTMTKLSKYLHRYQPDTQPMLSTHKKNISVQSSDSTINVNCYNIDFCGPYIEVIFSPAQLQHAYDVCKLQVFYDDRTKELSSMLTNPAGYQESMLTRYAIPAAVVH